MPLLGRQPFVREKPKKSLLSHGDREFFYCKHTQEIFTDYETLFQRVILCNSLVWTCALTSRPGLTFQEAVESEKKARLVLASFPPALKIPVLYVATFTRRSRIGDMCEDVYAYVRDNFFIGDIVEVVIRGTRKTCQVTAIASPSSSDKKFGSPKAQGSPKGKTSSNAVEDKYEVCEIDAADDIQICHEVAGTEINRPKGAYNKDKNKLFLKQNITLKEGILVVKDNIVSKKGLKTLSAKNLCGGKTPNFKPSQTKNGNASKKKENVKKSSPSNETAKGRNNKKDVKNGQMDINKALMKQPAKKVGVAKSLAQIKEEEAAKERKREELRLQFEIDRNKLKEDREKDREKQKEEKRLMAEFIMEWRKSREDLECDDFKDLPQPTPVKCNIPSNVFGDALIIVEFLHDFGHLLKVKNTFSNGFTLDLMEKALIETDIDGVFNDLLQMLLLAVFKQQEAEDEVQSVLNTNMSEKRLDDLLKEDFDPNTSRMIETAKAAATWSKYYHGTVLRKMPLDPFTLTELVRQHILASGSEVQNRYGDRGFYTAIENPGLTFKMEEPEIIKELSISTVFLLSPEHKVKIMKVLVEQLATYETYRECVEEYLNKMRRTQYELRMLKGSHKAIIRKEKEQLKKKLEIKSDVANDKEGTLPAVVEAPNEAELAKEAEERVLKVEEFLKKEKELVSTISKLKGAGLLQPIGQDRAFRRYWIFRSIGGIFVEDEDPFLGECSSTPTPLIPMVPAVVFLKNQDELPLGYMKRYLSEHGKESSQDEMPLSLIKRYLTAHKQEDKNGMSDKENDASDSATNESPEHVHSKSQKKLSDANPRINSPSKSSKKTASVADEKEDAVKPQIFGLCTANMETCTVHGSARKPVLWGFFSEETALDQLIAGLNPRGEREGRLKEFLVQEKEFLKASLGSCPITKLNLDFVEIGDEARKSARNKSAFANLHPNDALENTFREALLDNDEKIWTGGLGGIKVKDREAWRDALMERSYDMQCDDLCFGAKRTRLPMTSIERMDIDSDSGVLRSSSPPIASELVIEMATALLQVAQGVDPKFLIEPLAEDEKFKVKWNNAINKIEKLEKKHLALKDAGVKTSIEEDSSDDEDELNGMMPKSPFQRWEESLMSCTNLSQLFVHLATFERSVAWKRSAANAICRVCRRRADAENMLLCDGCDRGYHMYCLKPALKNIPKGDWFCPPCEPTVKEDKVEKVINYKDVSGSEDEDEEMLSEDEEEENEDAESEEEIPNDNFCKKCRKGGDLLCCDKCPLSYHLSCHNPPLKRIPRGTWQCGKCTAKGDKKKSIDIATPKPKAKPKPKRNSEPLPAPTRSSKRLANGSEEFPLDFLNCKEIVTQLSQHKDGWPFLRPVTKKDAPNYHKIIKRPVDLGGIRSRLNNQSYLANSQFVADICLMFQNCEVYNGEETLEYEAGKRLARVFHTLCRKFKIDDSTSTARTASDESSEEMPTKRLRGRTLTR